MIALRLIVVTADYRLGGYKHLVSLPDRLTDLGTYGLMETVAHWRDLAADDLLLIHDRSSALAREQHVWDTILSTEVPQTVVGQDQQVRRFPLNVREIGFGGFPSPCAASARRCSRRGRCDLFPQSIQLGAKLSKGVCPTPAGNGNP